MTNPIFYHYEVSVSPEGEIHVWQNNYVNDFCSYEVTEEGAADKHYMKTLFLLGFELTKTTDLGWEVFEARLESFDTSMIMWGVDLDTAPILAPEANVQVYVTHNLTGDYVECEIFLYTMNWHDMLKAWDATLPEATYQEALSAMGFKKMHEGETTTLPVMKTEAWVKVDNERFDPMETGFEPEAVDEDTFDFDPVAYADYTGNPEDWAQVNH